MTAPVGEGDAPAWLETLAQACLELPGLEVEGTVQLGVTADKKGLGSVHWRYGSGKVREAAPGDLPGADLVLTSTHEQLCRLLAGQTSPAVAFMRGELKASGDGRLLLELLASTASADFAAWLEGLRRSGWASSCSERS